jgi:hypothetical protein
LLFCSVLFSFFIIVYFRISEAALPNAAVSLRTDAALTHTQSMFYAAVDVRFALDPFPFFGINNKNNKR